MSEYIYIPDNNDLLAVLDGLPRNLCPYRDHAALLIYFTCQREWIPRQNKKDGFARLHSWILRKYIPDRQVKPLRDHLVKCGVLELDGYSTGNYSRGYRITDQFNGLSLRWGLSNRRLIQKRRVWRNSVITEDTPVMRELAERRKPVTDAMRQTLDRLSLSAEPSQVERALRGKGIDQAHLCYACSIIAHCDHDGLHMDSFGWRIHSIITHTTSKLRPFLRFDSEPLIELDVGNSQPLILAAALRNPPLCATYIGNAQHNGSKSCVRGSVLDILRSVPEREIKEYSQLCEAGMFYEALQNSSNGNNREEIKRLVFRDVFYGKVQQRGPTTEMFEKLWPGIFNALCELKQKCGYKIVAQILQRMESTIMIDGVCGRIVSEHPEVEFLTIHDAAIAVVDRGGVVRSLVKEEFDRLGVQAPVKQKTFSNNISDDTCFCNKCGIKYISDGKETSQTERPSATGRG